MKIYNNLTKCRICGSEELDEVVKIEDQYLSPTFVESNENNPLSTIKVPHTLVLCSQCNLLQLKEMMQLRY